VRKVKEARRAGEASERRAAVCLFALHPLLVSEFQRILSGQPFRLLSRRIESDRLVDLHDLSIPRASVYVLEAHPQNQFTEALVSAILGRQRTARVIVLAEKFAEAIAFPLLRLGTKGLVSYSEVESQLPRALGVVGGGGFWVPRALLSKFVESTLDASRQPRTLPTAGRLSRREQEVLELLLENLSNKEIAGKLHISSRTAKFHVSNLLSKHGVQRRADLIVLAFTQRAS
jgi:DNA-binding NarL/FixJ family response regulator